MESRGGFKIENKRWGRKFVRTDGGEVRALVSMDRVSLCVCVCVCRHSSVSGLLGDSVVNNTQGLFDIYTCVCVCVLGVRA